MKADAAAQLRLLELQALDSRLDRLAHQRRTLPELAEISRLDALVEALRDELVRCETEVSDLGRESARCEREVEQVRSRRERDQARLASGSVTVPRQLQDLEHEVATLGRRQSDLEDAQLEVMEQAEGAQNRLAAVRGQRADHLSGREQAAAACADAVASIEAEALGLRGERDEVAATLPADLRTLYERIRTAEGGVGAGEVARGRCGGCRLELMNNEKSAIRAAPPDEVLRHEECSRIMIRTAESGL